MSLTKFHSSGAADGAMQSCSELTRALVFILWQYKHYMIDLVFIVRILCQNCVKFFCRCLYLYDKNVIFSFDLYITGTCNKWLVFIRPTMNSKPSNFLKCCYMILFYFWRLNVNCKRNTPAVLLKQVTNVYSINILNLTSAPRAVHIFWKTIYECYPHGFPISSVLTR